jgi:hypothetical protein
LGLHCHDASQDIEEIDFNQARLTAIDKGLAVCTKLKVSATPFPFP